ncbi:MAG: lamin tail domain-containing protein [Candidatus Kerfeldbacteria bacterium]|nr:lamin tail domain-containing protein [Candidatus Kerfeldbacteria bacterium]
MKQTNHSARCSVRVLFGLLVLFIFASVRPTFACEEESETTTSTTTYSSAMQLSELYPRPASEDEEEFIELYNSSDAVIDVNGWKVADASGKTYAINSEQFISTSVNGHGYFVIPQSISKIYLNNDEDSVTLYQPNDTALDSTTYTDATEQQSWSQSSGDWQWSTTVTEGEKNIITAVAEDKNTDATDDDSGDSTDNSSNDSTTNTPEANSDDFETSTAVSLSELLPDPTGVDSTDEWIEIANTGDGAVYIGGWQLTDQSTYYTIGDLTIAAGEYLLFEIGETGMSLNNSGDTVYLIDPYGDIVNGTQYVNAPEGESWARFGDDWQWTNALTPAEANATSTTSDEGSSNDSESNDASSDNEEETGDVDVVSIELLRTLEDGQGATVEGVVTVLPGVLGSQYFYIQDDTSGVQVYSYSKTFPEGLALGDRVRVTGEKSTSRGETRIKTSTADNYVVVGHGETVTPRDASILDESLEGLLVQVEGSVVDSSSTEANIDDLITVVLKSSANIDSSLLEEGKNVAVVGIVGQSDTEYRLMPRSNDDITELASDDIALIQPAQAATTGNPAALSSIIAAKQRKNTTLLVVVIIALLAVISGLSIRYKKTIAAAVVGIKKQGTTSTTPNAATTNTATPSKTTTIFDIARKKIEQ